MKKPSFLDIEDEFDGSGDILRPFRHSYKCVTNTMQEGLYRLETLMAIIYLATIGTLATTLQARYKRLRAGCEFRADLAMMVVQYSTCF